MGNLFSYMVFKEDQEKYQTGNSMAGRKRTFFKKAKQITD
jgi:hypothetical protein